MSVILSVGVNVNGGLSLCVSPVIDRWPVNPPPSPAAGIGSRRAFCHMSSPILTQNQNDSLDPNNELRGAKTLLMYVM